MTNEQKLQLLKSTDYGMDYELEIKEENGLTLVKSFYSGYFFNIDDIELIDYNCEENVPIAKQELNDNFVKCNCCGEWLQLGVDNYCQANDTGNTYCESCAESNLHYCERCGCYHESEEYLVYTRNHCEELWCEHCRENYAFYSEYDENYYSSEYHEDATVYFDGYSETWTREQAWDNAYYCEECDEFYDSEMYNHDAEMCFDCANSRNNAIINSYHASKNSNSLHFFGESKFTNWAGVGFELEVDTTYQNAQNNQQNLLNALKEEFGDRITFERDGSLENGFEIISAPHTKDEMSIVDWAKLLQLCKEHGYVSHDAKTCGLHFHVSGYMFGATKEKQHDTIAKVIAFYNFFYEDFVKLSRRPNEEYYSAYRWANKYEIYYHNNIDTYKTECQNIVRRYAQGYISDRYRAINLTNTDRNELFKTVEFRINRGTLNPNTFYATYDLIITLIKNAKKIDWTSPDFFNPKKWLSGCKPNTYAYIVKRNAFEGVFYLPQANTETEYTQENA